MPFTFSHPAAVVPLRRYGVLSALVIGSICPDLTYIVPINALRASSHTLTGLFLNCLPAGLLVYLLFHFFFKGPLLSLFPRPILEKLGHHTESYRSLPNASWYAVTLSILLGATTHLAWDSFTHASSVVVKITPALQQQLFSIGEYRVYLYKILQHVSTLVGFAFLGWWSWKWYKQAPGRTVHPPINLSVRQRYFFLITILSIPLAAGILVAASAVDANSMVTYLQFFAGRAIFTALPTLAVMLALYSLWWHMRGR